jgi:hypothetical protein
VRLLTVRHPWAEAIARGDKLVENRGRGFPKRYRGLIGIHSAVAPAVHGFLDHRVRELEPRPLPTTCTFGAVIALADLVDVHPASGCCHPWGEDSYQPNNPEERPVGQVTHLVLERPLRITPVPAKGALGLWRPDDDLAVEIAHRLAERMLCSPDSAAAMADRAEVDDLWSMVRPPEPVR